MSPTQGSLPDNTQHPQETNIHAPGGIRTRNTSKRAVADLRLRPRGHWDRLMFFFILFLFFFFVLFLPMALRQRKICCGSKSRISCSCGYRSFCSRSTWNSVAFYSMLPAGLLLWNDVSYCLYRSLSRQVNAWILMQKAVYLVFTRVSTIRHHGGKHHWPVARPDGYLATQPTNRPIKQGIWD
jgi:hypothetical protein